MAPSHYVNQRSLNIRGLLCNSPENILQELFMNLIHKVCPGITLWGLLPYLPAVCQYTRKTAKYFKRFSSSTYLISRSKYLTLMPTGTAACIAFDRYLPIADMELYWLLKIVVKIENELRYIPISLEKCDSTTSSYQALPGIDLPFHFVEHATCDHK